MLQIAICDDEKRDLLFVADMVQDILAANKIDYEVQLFCSANEMLQDLKQADIAILDIAMEELNGIELGRQLKIKFSDIHIVYITSYEFYCMQAINEVHAFSFLCKPIEKDKLQRQLLNLVDEIRSSDDAKEKMFYKVCSADEKNKYDIKLRLKDILYFEYIKTNRKVKIILEEQQYTCPYVMEKLIEELKEEGFAVNCRGQLVNLRCVMKIKGYQIYMQNGDILPLSQKRVGQFKAALNDFIHNNS